MKLLIISETFPFPPIAGHKMALYNYLRLLSENNCITFAGFHEHGEVIMPDQINMVKKYCRVGQVHSMVDMNNKNILCHIMAADPLSLKRYHNQSFINNLKTLLKKEHYDLVHCFGFNVGQFGKYAIGLPKVFTPVDCTTLFYRRMTHQREVSILRRMYYAVQAKKIEKYENRMCMLFDACYVFSEEDRLALIKICPESNVFAVPFGVDVAKQTDEAPLKLDGPTLVFSGNMSTKVNINSALYFYKRIFPLIRQELPSVYLIIAGSGPDKRIKELGKEDDKVIITGYVENLIPYIMMADVYVAPILSATGIQTRVLEAMALGKAIVSTSQPMKIFHALSGVHAFITDDPAEFAQNTIRLLKDVRLKERMGIAARSLVCEKYSWRAAIKMIEQIHQDALNTWKIKNEIN